MPAVPGIINNGVISKWLSSKPSVTQMLVVDADGNVGRQAIPSAPALAWGNITGTLSAQTDLQLALDGKASFIHGHAIGDVTNLSSTLTAIDIALAALDANKANTSSLANYLPLAGGTLTGALSGTTGTFTDNIYAGAAAEIGFTGRTRITSPSNNKLWLNGTASSNGVQFSLGNGVLDLRDRTDSGPGSLLVGTLTASGAIVSTANTSTFGPGVSSNGAWQVDVSNLNHRSWGIDNCTLIGRPDQSALIFPNSTVAGGPFVGRGAGDGANRTGFNFGTTSITASARSGYSQVANTFTNAGNIEARYGTNATNLYVYGTYTDASNYRRFSITSTTGGAFTLGVDGLGTGSIGNTLLVSESLYITSSGNAGTRGFAMYQNSTDVVAPLFSSFKSRGTYASPTVVASGDLVAFWGARPYDGSSYPQDIAHMAFAVSGSVSTGNVPLSWAIRTGGTPASYNTTILAHHSGRVGVGDFGSIISSLTQPSGQFHVKSSAAGTIGAVIQLAASATANALEVQNSAGSILTRIASNGDIYGPVFNGTTYGMSAHASGGFYCGPDAGLFFGNTTWPSSGIQSAIRFDSPYFSTVGAVALRSGTNPQVFRIYNQFADSSNYDRAFMRWNSNVLEIGTERLGSYTTTRSLSFVFQGATRGGLSPTGGFWVGDANAATDQSAVICGMYGTASIPYSAIVGGMRGNTYLYGQTVVAFGGRPFNSANISGGTCQSWLLTISGYTTDATQTRMRAGDTSATWDWFQRLTVRSGYTVSYLACIKGIKSDGTARARFWRLIDITRIGNTTALDVAAQTLGTDHNPSSCTITIQADDTNEAMEILVGGVAGETWRWTGTLYATEMQYGS